MGGVYHLEQYSSKLVGSNESVGVKERVGTAEGISVEGAGDTYT